MSDERRYDEDEVAAILEIATRTEERPGGRAPETGGAVRGLTLAEIQQIGVEVGITPDRIAEGARVLDVRASAPGIRRKLLGFPISVGTAVDLPRPLSDQDWDRLVGEIRAHFNAHGKLDRSGTLRSWRNGNLRIEVGPTEDGRQIRMQTYRQQSRVFVTMGATFAGIGTLLTVASLFTGSLDPDLWLFAALGGGFVTAGLLPLRTWARRRMEQMEAIAASAVRMAGRALPAGEGGTDFPSEA